MDEQSPEQQQLVGDELTGIGQLSVGNPKRHSTTPALSDFTGITNNAAFLASLLRWHACGIVNGLVPPPSGTPAGVQNWGLTRIGELFQWSFPTITSLSPATAVHGTAQITVTVNGQGFRNGSVVMAGAVALATTYVSPTQLTALYTPPAAAGTVPFTVVNATVGATSPASNFTVT